MFYVYEWYIVETNEIIYVGKGTKNRYKVTKHNNLFNEMIKRFECSSRIVREFDTEKDAFEYEFIRINELKEIGQCVCNIYQGGTGGSTDWWNEDLRKKYSEHNVMKSESQRKRMSEQNPMKNPNISSKVNSQKRKPVIIGEKEYNSIKMACEELRVHPDVIRTWCKKGINSKGELCRFKGDAQVYFSGKRYNKGGCKTVLYKGITYESAKDLSDDIGKDYSTILKWLSKGFDSSGNECVYVDDLTVHTYKPNKYSKKPIILNGVRYNTISDASKATGVCRDTISNALKGKHKSRKIITCEYDNQKPSQGKSDNSTLKGSTTNG